MERSERTGTERTPASSAKTAEWYAWLARALAAAVAAWPDVRLAPELFAAHVAAKADALADPGGYPKLHTTDLYLARAGAEADLGAVRAFRERLAPELERGLSRIKLPVAVVEDLRSTLGEALLFGHNGPPRLLEYGGLGRLGAWLRSVAVHAALNARRDWRKHVHVDEASRLADLAVGPELAYLKKLYAAEFKEAFRKGLEAASARERTLLRLHYLDGLNLDAIGAFYRVNRSTVSRWLAGVRASLFSRIKRDLSRRWALSDEQFESILRLAQSGLDTAIVSLLRDKESP
jgi:RNA polymerase sigma-70 factor (ECF subfamily)